MGYIASWLGADVQTMSCGDTCRVLTVAGEKTWRSVLRLFLQRLFLENAGSVCDTVCMQYMNTSPGEPLPPAEATTGEDEQHDELAAPRTLPLTGIGLALLLAAAAFFSGLHVGSDTRLEANVASLFASSPAETTDLSRFWKVWELLDERFVSASSSDPLSTEERIDGAIRGLVESYGDPYTVYLPPEESEAFEETISGNFEGVGMEVGQRNGVLTVIAPLPDTPADRAGIKAGDSIIRINGESTERLNIDQAIKLIRGEKGTAVTLTLFREGESELLEISVVRDTISIPTIETETRDGVFIIRLYNFSAIAEARVQEALREYVRSGQKKLIFDLRGNPGGYLQGAVNIASFFLPTGKVVVRESFGEGEEEHVFRSTGRTLGGYAPDKMVVLVDQGSASASEILAGALKAHKVATIMGMQTFGKGSVQELIPLSGGSSLKVTVARWLTPDGSSISDGGLAPDIEVPFEVPEGSAEGTDPQLEAAIEFLKQ